MCDDDPDLHVDLHQIETEDDRELSEDASNPPQDKACQFPELHNRRFSYESLQERRKRELRSEILNKINDFVQTYTSLGEAGTRIIMRDISHLNSVEPSIQFTIERENDRRLSFLDLNVYRTHRGNLETSVYRKPTHTNKYLAFDSHHPICHKKSVTRTLLTRADCLPSSCDSRAKERKYVFDV